MTLQNDVIAQCTYYMEIIPDFYEKDVGEYITI